MKVRIARFMSPAVEAIASSYSEEGESIKNFDMLPTYTGNGPASTV
jgi:hypothetical protein